MDITTLIIHSEELQRHFQSKPKGLLTCEEFVALVRYLHQRFTPASHSKHDEIDFVMHCVDMYKQMDVLGRGVVSYKDVTNYIMHREMLEDQGVLFRSFKYRRCRNMIEGVSVRGQPVRQLCYYPPPLDRLLVITEGSENIQFFLPPNANEELPRASISLGHFALMTKIKVLCCVHLGDELGLITSTVVKDGGPAYLNYWLLPRTITPDSSESRLDDYDSEDVTMPVIRSKVKVVHPVTLMFKSSMGLLVTASDKSNSLMIWQYSKSDGLVLQKKYPGVHIRPMTCVTEVEWLGLARTMLVTGSHDGTFALLDMHHVASPRPPSKLDIVQRVQAHEHGVMTICQCTDHKVFFSAGVFKEEASCRIELWLDDGQAKLHHEPRKYLSGHMHQIVDLRVIGEEHQLISSDYSGQIRVWDIKTLRIKQVLSSQACNRQHNPLRDIVVLGPSPENQQIPWTLVVASKSVEVWMKARLRQKDNLITSFYNMRFKELVLVGTKRLYLWDAFTGSLNKTYDVDGLLRHKAEVTTACLGDGGKVLIIGDDTGCISVCSYSYGHKVAELDPHKGPITSLAYCEEDRVVLSSSTDGICRILDLRDPEKGIASQSLILREIARKPVLRRKQQPTDSSLVKKEGIEITHAGFDSNLNMIATVSMNAKGDHFDVNTWGYEMADLTGAVMEPCGRNKQQQQPQQPPPQQQHHHYQQHQHQHQHHHHQQQQQPPSFAATALCFCHPFPFLAGGTDAGIVHLWETKNWTYSLTLAQRAHRRRSSTAAQVIHGSVVRLTADDDGPNHLGITALLSAPLESGLRIFAGDESGSLTVWHLDAEHIRALVYPHNEATQQTTASLGAAAIADEEGSVSSNEQPETDEAEGSEEDSLASIIAHASRRMYQKGYDAYRAIKTKVETEKLDRLRELSWRRAQLAKRQDHLPLFQLEAHSHRVISLSFIKSPASVVSTGTDNVVRIWNAINGDRLGTLDLQDAGAHLKTWKLHVVEDRSHDMMALAEAKKVLSSTRDLTPETTRRRSTMKKKIQSINFLARDTLRRSTIIRPEINLRQQALQCIQMTTKSVQTNAIAKPVLPLVPMKHGRDWEDILEEAEKTQGHLAETIGPRPSLLPISNEAGDPSAGRSIKRRPEAAQSSSTFTFDRNDNIQDDHNDHPNWLRRGRSPISRPSHSPHDEVVHPDNNNLAPYASASRGCGCPLRRPAIVCSTRTKHHKKEDVSPSISGLESSACNNHPAEGDQLEALHTTYEILMKNRASSKKKHVWKQSKKKIETHLIRPLERTGPRQNMPNVQAVIVHKLAHLKNGRDLRGLNNSLTKW